MNENNFMKAEDVARKTSQEKKNSHRTLCLCSPRAHPLLRCAVHARRILSTYAKSSPMGSFFQPLIASIIGSVSASQRGVNMNL